MDSNKTIKSLWIGNQLSPLELLCINSYLQNGHEFELYTYNNIKNLPSGVKQKDARQILSDSELTSLKNNGYNLHFISDYFRYILIYRLGGWWSDLDAVCIKPFDFDQDYVFMQEQNAGQSKTVCGLIKCPKHSPIMEYCWSKASIMLSTVNSFRFGAFGPGLIDSAIKEFHLTEFAYPPSFFAPIPWYKVRTDLFKPFEFDQNTYSLHLYNYRWDMDNLPRFGSYPYDSIFETLKRQYGVSTSLDGLLKEFLKDIRTFGLRKGSMRVARKLKNLVKTYQE